MPFVFFVFPFFLAGAVHASTISNTSLKPCHQPPESADIFPSHYYDKEIQLAPTFSRLEESNEPLFYKALFVKPGSAYAKMGIQAGDVLSTINGQQIKVKNPAALDGADLEQFKKLKSTKKFTLNRCLKSE